MELSALMTSAGINISLCVVFFSLYSVLRKQPSNVGVYFGQRLDQLQSTRQAHFCFDRLVPSASWIVKAWEASEDEIFACGGIDAVVFLRIVVFSIRVFSIAAIICIFLVLPLNYYGQETHQTQTSSEIDVFTIANVKEGSRWFWAHCLALHVITGCACLLLYFEYKTIAKMRLVHITGSPSRPSHFTVLLRAIPWSSGESYSNIVKKYFNNYYASSYLSHQMVYQSGTVQKLMEFRAKSERSDYQLLFDLDLRKKKKGDAERMYKMIKSPPVNQYCGPSIIRCGLCGGTSNSFKMLSNETEIDEGRNNLNGGLELRDKECEAALIFFRTRYAALIASQALQSPDPMLWVTEAAPEPDDVFWSNLCVPFRLLWIRRISTLMASIVFMISFLGPTTFVQGLTQLEKLEMTFPFLRKFSKRKFVGLITGYLPSVVLMLFLYIVPPLMLLFATLEGSISRSSRKKSACVKVLYFMIWNVFFANVLSGTYMSRLDVFTKSSPQEVANFLAAVVPRQSFFFMTYIMTSGWASLSFELMQPFVLLCNWFYRYILRKKDAACDPFTFPYHTEVPRVLLIGLLGFVFSVLAPLLLPFLLVYFFLAYLVYRNQIMNVYITRYQTGGLYWPIVHNAVIFSLVLAQIIAAAIFGMKRSSIASSFMIPLIICTILFNMYCREKFLPLFKSNAAQVLVEMDREDEQSGAMEGIHEQLQSAYCQFRSTVKAHSKPVLSEELEKNDEKRLPDPEDHKPVKSKERALEPSAENPPWEMREINQMLPVTFSVKNKEQACGPSTEVPPWETGKTNQTWPVNVAVKNNELPLGTSAGSTLWEIREINQTLPINLAVKNNECKHGLSADHSSWEIPEKNQSLPVNFMVKSNDLGHGPLADLPLGDVNERNCSVPANFALMINEQAPAQVSSNNVWECRKEDQT